MKAKAVAVCAMMVALSVVVMLLGAVLELGMYAAPLLVGIFMIPIGKLYGRRYHAMVYIASGILCFLTVPNVEQNLMFVGLFGWYPILRPALQTLPKVLRWIAKAVIFNAAVICIEWLVITVFAPEVLGGALLWLLLILGNVTFALYDRAIPKAEILMERIKK